MQNVHYEYNNKYIVLHSYWCGGHILGVYSVVIRCCGCWQGEIGPVSCIRVFDTLREEFEQFNSQAGRSSCLTLWCILVEQVLHWMCCCAWPAWHQVGWRHCPRWHITETTSSSLTTLPERIYILILMKYLIYLAGLPCDFSWRDWYWRTWGQQSVIFQYSRSGGADGLCEETAADTRQEWAAYHLIQWHRHHHPLQEAGLN